MHISKPNIWALPLILTLALLGCSEDDGRTTAEHIERAQQFLATGEVNAAGIEVKNALRSEPDNPDTRWLAGQIYLAAGQSAAAEQEFTKALQLGIQRANSDLPLVRAWIAQGQLQKGLNHFEQKELGTLSDEAKTLFAQLLLESGEVTRAEEIFTDLLESTKNSSDALVGLARIEMSRGNHELTDAYIQRALTAEPNNPFANLMAGELSVTSEKFEEAQAYFLVAAADPRTQILASLGTVRVHLANKRLDDAKTAVSKILSEQPRVPLAHFLQGLIYYQLGEPDKAVDALETAHNLAPKHNPTLLLLGKLYLDTGRLELANNTLSTVIANDPSHSTGRNLLAATKVRMNLPGEALALLGDTVSEESDDLLGLITAGTALLSTGEYSRGALLLEKAASLAEDPRLIRSQLARAYLASGNIETAIDEFRSLTESDASNPEHQLLLAYSLIRQGKPDLAMKSVVQLKTQGLTALAHNLEGAIELAGQHLSKARELFESAVEADPKFIPARLNLARIANAENRSADARIAFDKVLEIEPTNIVATLGIAELELKSDNKSAAVRILKESASATNNVRVLLALSNILMADSDSISALNYASQARRLDRSNPDAAAVVATIQAKQGLFMEALNTLESIPKNRRNDAFYLRLAETNRLNNQPAQARKILSEIINRAPNNVSAIVNLISLELQTDQIEAAEALLAAFPAEADPDKNIVPALQGDIHRTAGRHEQALESYSQAFGAMPTSQLTSAMAGELIALGRQPQAVTRLAKWVSEHPKDLGNNLLLANLHMLLNQKSQASALYEKILTDHPSQLLALNNLAWLYYEQGNPKALALAEQLADLEPERADVLDTAGWILVNQGDKKRGLRLLIRAHDKSVDLAEIHFHLAVAQHRNGNLDEAVRLLASLQADHPEYASGTEIQDFAAKITAP